MQELLFIRLNELILLIYLFSIACYFFDFVKKFYKIRRIGFVTLGIVWVLQTISLSFYVTATNQVPLGNVFDVFFALSWFIISISIVINVIKQVNISIFLFNLIGVVFIAISTFQPMHYQGTGEKLNVINELLIVHVTFAIISYAVFAFAFVNSILYLIQFKNLKQKRFDQKYFRISSVATLEQVVFYNSLVGFIFIILSIILGAQWGFNTIGMKIIVDPKVIMSIIITILYGVYLMLRVRHTISKHKLIYFNIILFCLSMINLLFASHISDFHQWTGI
ncbi:cytochrome c biogenesis protein CcsA [Staphylococcus edaphicus]|uniref:Cytochrome C assembly protein n=1 Tax=Staphylococcus edaphicus TaxID=1955013 RepID=A0A2C6WJK7_9STAP|nr:cytochrome c biogenesis protein CcsA [Staphylococcus edaphicus]PHK50958.1 cytochrome C assembly protein [Staphylococcus edaphicus]UQW82646.1 cytochrome c biogenesis protein [Staphylococcus edaphicus]